jgi:hypothetical protein
MRLKRTAPRRWTCHWSEITRRTADGREVRTPVWICEYPYRTMMASPCTDCEGCRAAMPAPAPAGESLDVTH